MRELVEAILLLHRSREAGRTDHSEFEVLNLCDLTRELLAEALARHPERERDLTIEALDEVLVRGQTALLASAVRNLLDNAFKFTGRGDRVRVEVAGAGDRAIVTVEDAGAGIPEAERERIFDPFYRGAEARAATRGFGLGLPILRRVARAHGGDVEVTTSALGGARFALSLPNYEAERRGG
jgi:two-component system OmpR family sensor kinase